MFYIPQYILLSVNRLCLLFIDQKKNFFSKLMAFDDWPTNCIKKRKNMFCYNWFFPHIFLFFSSFFIVFFFLVLLLLSVLNLKKSVKLFFNNFTILICSSSFTAQRWHMKQRIIPLSSAFFFYAVFTCFWSVV